MVTYDFTNYLKVDQGKVAGLIVGFIVGPRWLGWLKSGKKCDLIVINCENYDHTSQYHLPIKPSPNLPNDWSIALYPSLCLFEGMLRSSFM